MYPSESGSLLSLSSYFFATCSGWWGKSSLQDSLKLQHYSVQHLTSWLNIPGLGPLGLRRKIASSPGPLLLLLLEGLVCQIKCLNGWGLGNVIAHSVTMTTSWEPPQQLTVCWRSQELLPSLVSCCQVVVVVSIACCSGSPDGASCYWTA